MNECHNSYRTVPREAEERSAVTDGGSTKQRSSVVG